MYANEETIQAIIDETLLRIPDKDEHKQFWQNTCIDITNFENKSIENLEPGAYIHYGALDSVYDLFPMESFSVKRNPETVAILTSCEMFVLEVDRRYKQLTYQLSGGGYVEFTDFAGKIYVYNATDIDGDTGNFSRQFNYLWHSSNVKNTIPWYNQNEVFQKYVNDEYVSATFGYDSIVHKKGSSEYVYSFPEETGTIALSENIPTKLSELTNDSGYITINSIGNGTLTITQNGTNKGIFTANQSSNSTIDITVPTKLSNLTNDSGYITIGSVGNGTLTITQNGTSKGTFSANQSGNASINLTDTTYENKSAASGGTAVSLVTTGEKYAWNAKSNFSGAYADLTGLPTLGTAAAKDIPASGNASATQVVLGSDTRLTNSRPASDVYAWAKASTKPSYTASEVGAVPRIVAKIPVTTSPSAGWRRICKITYGNYGYENGFVTISGGWNKGAPSNAIISMCCRHNTASMNLIHNIATDGMIQQVRLVNIFGSSYWFDAYMKGQSGEVSEQYFIFFGNFDISDIQNSATIITDGTASASVNLTTTTVTGTLITSGNIGSQSVSYANAAGSAPASDVYAWAKASTKPSYSYSEISGTPTIPTVNNGTLTIQKNGTNVATFTANQSGNSTANITVPTKLSELTNDSGYITSSGSCANADALQNSSPDEGTGASTIVKRTSSGQVKAVFYNMSGRENDINSFTSHVAFVSSDGWIRKTSKANFSTWLLTWTKLGSTTGNTQLSYTGTYTEFFVVLDLGFYAETFYFVAPALGAARYYFGGTTNTADGSSWVLRASRSNSTYYFKVDRVHQDGTAYTSQVTMSVYAR